MRELPGCLSLLFPWLGAGPIQTVSRPQEGHGDEEALPTAPELLPYRVRDDFLSPAEASFFRVLKLTVGEQFLVFPKVSLRDLFYVTQPHQNQRALNRIAQKHVDFVLCDPGTLQPVLGLELDDRSHQRQDRVERDEFVERVFAAAGLSLVRVPVQRSYQPAQVAALLSSSLGVDQFGTVPGPPPAAVAEATTHRVGSTAPDGGAPECPKCGVPMVPRTAQRGENRGQSFYGCPNYPRCRQVLPEEPRSL